MRRTAIAIVGVALSLALVAGPAGAQPHHKAKADGVGVTHVVEDETKQYEGVKLVAFTDPATPGTSTIMSPQAGTRYVGVTLQIHDRSPGTDTGDADGNTSLIGTNKQVYSSTFAPIAGCTDFNDGQYGLTKGATEVGCVTFQVPSTVKIAKVTFNPNSGFSTNNAVWKLSPPA